MGSTRQSEEGAGPAWKREEGCWAAMRNRAAAREVKLGRWEGIGPDKEQGRAERKEREREKDFPFSFCKFILKF